MLVLITGQSDPSDPSQLQKRISVLRSRGVDVVVIGVGDVDTDELQRITTDDKSVDNKVILSRDYKGILQHSQDIADFACSEGKDVLKTGSKGFKLGFQKLNLPTFVDRCD